MIYGAKFSILTFSVTQMGVIGIDQAQVMPSEFSSILIQLPVVGLFIWYTLYSGKQNREWLDHLMTIQDERHQRTDALFEHILERMDIRQNQMADRMELLTQQLAVNSGAINEAMRLAELAEELKKLVKQSV